jgi:hypothetical protein
MLRDSFSALLLVPRHAIDEVLDRVAQLSAGRG